MSAATVEKPRYHTLKVPDPAHLLMRLKQGVKAGVLSRVPRTSFVGQEFLLVNERLKEGEGTKAWARVKLGQGAAFRDGQTAVQTLGAKLDGLTAREFSDVNEQVWFHPLVLLQSFDQPRDVTGVTHGGRRYTGEGTIEKRDEPTPQEMRGMDKAALLSLLQALEREFKRRGYDASKSEDLVNAARFVLDELKRRNAEVPSGQLIDEAMEIVQKGLFGYPAGKHQMSKKIAAMIPPHRIYVEPFVGSGAVLFAKEKADVEVVNDIRTDVADAWRALSKLTDADADLLKKKSWMSNREHWERLMASEYSGTADKLYKFLYTMRFGFARAAWKGYDSTSEGQTSLMPRKLYTVAPRAKGVRVYCGDYESVCRKYDSSDTFFFFDPPYVGTSNSVGEEKFDESAFFKMLKCLQGKWLLTYGVQGELPKMLRGSKFKVKTFETRRNARSQPGARDSTSLKQIIVTNFDPVKKDFAPIAASGEKKGRPIILDEVLDSFGDAVIRRAAVSVVGGLVNHGQTENDIDVLIKGPLDPATRKVIEFRIGRMLAATDPELAERVQFLDDELGGPFTPHVEAFDLVLVRRPGKEVIQMADTDKADPITELSTKPGPKRAVLQVHFRGRTAHFDLRLQQDGHLIGFTIAAQKAGAIPDVNTVEQGRRIADGFDVDGSAEFKPLLAPAKVQAFPKTRQPKEWLEAKDQVIKPGEVGATAEEEGVLIVIDRFSWEEGRIEPYYREMFFSGGKHLNGVVHARKLVGRGDGEGRAAAGETFWNLWLSKEALPSILSTRAVRRGVMPPDGRSWIPHTLEQATPKGYRYWEHKGEEAKRIRDELVKERYFTDENVRVVNGQFRRVVTKHYLATEPEPLTKRDGKGPLERPHRCKSNGCEKQATVAIVWSDGRAFVPACEEHKGYWQKKLSDVVTVRPLPQPSEKDGYVPPAGAVKNARLGLAWRSEYKRGGTDIGVARARDISNGRSLSLDTLRRMRSYFARHEVDSKAEGWNQGEDGYPSAGRIAWLLWGGDAGRSWAERIVGREDAKKSADVRRFVLARQSYKGQHVVREGPTRTKWFLMFPAGAAMHMLRMDVDPTDESGSVAGIHIHVIGTDLMELDGPADPGLSVNGYSVNPTKNTSSDWRIVDSGKVAVLEEEPNRWLLNFSGSDMKGHWEAEAEEPGGKMWTIRPSGHVEKNESAHEIRAVVLAKEAYSGDQRHQNNGRNVYECGVGPVPDRDDLWDTFEVDGADFVRIGKTSATNLTADVGDVIRVGVSELLSECGEKRQPLTWVDPMVVDRCKQAPMSVDEVIVLAIDDQIKKADGPWINVPVIKAEDERYVFGVVLEPNDGNDGNPLNPDRQKDTYSAKEIWTAWKRYAIEKKKLGLLHEKIVGNNNMILLDNYVAPSDMIVGDQKIRKGSWCMGALITSDILWRKIKDGTYSAWSIDGSAIRQLMRAA